MKNFLLLSLAVVLSCSFTVSFSNAVFAEDSQQIQTVQDTKQYKEQIRKQFEQRLGLTEKQKEKARQIHKQGHEAIAPIMQQIALKQKEIETVKMSRMAVRAQNERIDEIKLEILDLEKQAQKIRKRNSQEFEKILTKKQKAELAVMKAEGRAKFEQYHKARPIFQGIGSPNFLLKPLIPLPNENTLWK